MLVGVDPGLTGAIALVDEDRAIGVWDMPIAGAGTHRTVSAPLLADVMDVCLDEANSLIHVLSERYSRLSVAIEKVHAMPAQGVSSTFRFGQSLGVVEGILGAKRMPVKYVTPNKWKRYWNLIGKDKDAARARALEVYPEMADRLKRRSDCGRADALLIAGYADSL